MTSLTFEHFSRSKPRNCRIISICEDTRLIFGSLPLRPSCWVEFKLLADIGDPGGGDEFSAFRVLYALGVKTSCLCDFGVSSAVVIIGWSSPFFGLLSASITFERVAAFLRLPRHICSGSSPFLRCGPRLSCSCLLSSRGYISSNTLAVIASSGISAICLAVGLFCNVACNWSSVGNLRKSLPFPTGDECSLNERFIIPAMSPMIIPDMSLCRRDEGVCCTRRKQASSSGENRPVPGLEPGREPGEVLQSMPSREGAEAELHALTVPGRLLGRAPKTEPADCRLARAACSASSSSTSSQGNSSMDVTWCELKGLSLSNILKPSHWEP
mmetsp:Transcript_88483/g.162200  ORF Transcript_88483/g.162200 Transcript_88483/m.162200 type:complete len:327 (+) Transcript_88483:159-1139(+)